MDDTVGIWNLTIWNPDFFKDQISKGRTIALAIAMVPAIKKTRPGCVFRPAFGSCAHQTAEQKPFLMI